MRMMLLPYFAVMTVGATEPGHRAPPSRSPEGQAFTIEQPEEVTSKDCRDRIHLVRAARGLPRLDAEPAKPDDALLIAAVDHQVEGCDVLVMRGDTSDIRPLPRFDHRAADLIPAN